VTRFARAGTLAIASGLLLGVGCPSLDPFACQGDEQCTLMAEGVCHEDRGACSYPDDECPSGRRFSETAGALARTCVEEEPAASSSSSSGEPPLAVCGNAVIEGDEECDEGEDVACDACLPDCRLAAVVRWRATHDEHGSGDFFDSAVVDPQSGDVVAVGRTFPGQVSDSADKDRLVVRYDAEGSLRWVVADPRPGRDDLNCVVFGPSGELLAAGMRISDAREELWVGRYDEDGATDLLEYGGLEMQATHGDDCVFTTDGRLVVAGRIDGPDVETGFEKWDRLVLDDALGTPTPFVVQGADALEGTRDIAYRTAAGPDGSVLVGGNITINTRNASQRWLARFDASGVLLDEYVDGGPGLGQEEIFGLAVGDGVVFAAGSEVFGDGGTEQAWVARFTLDGLQRGWQSNLGLEPPAIATEIALDANGDLLIVADLEDVGTALTKLDPEGNCEWLVPDPGGARRLSGITVGPDGGVIVAGATTFEDDAATDALVVSLRL
jgi:hypothetical protein